MKRLNESLLQIGDIILTTTTTKLSKTIRRFTKSDISHAMMYVESHSVIDSTGDGVHARNTQRLFLDDQCAVHVLRPIPGLTEAQSRSIVTYVRGRIGTEYSKTEAARSVLGGSKTSSRKQFCSRLVAQAYASAGINLVSDPNYCSPEDLKQSARLVTVPDATVEITDRSVEELNNILDTSQLMHEVTSALLKGARAKNPDIQDVNDIDHHLMATPSDDDYFTELYKQSGYLTLWALERDKSGWHYDLSAMESARGPEQEKLEYCRSLIHDGEEGLLRFEVNRAGYSILADEFPLETFRLLKALYEKLVELHKTRRHVAAQWLALHAPEALPAGGRPPSLIPHTNEWFNALEAWNLPQAMHTRDIVKQSGHDAVCSICGDDPARDYRLVGESLPAGAVHTLRLCNDCWKIRGGMYGESLALLA